MARTSLSSRNLSDAYEGMAHCTDESRSDSKTLPCSETSNNDLSSVSETLSIPLLSSRSASAPPAPTSKKQTFPETLRGEDIECSSVGGDSSQQRDRNVDSVSPIVVANDLWAMSRSTNPDPIDIYQGNPEDGMTSPELPTITGPSMSLAGVDEFEKDVPGSVRVVRPNPLKTLPPIPTGQRASFAPDFSVSAVFAVPSVLPQEEDAVFLSQTREAGVDYSPWCETVVIEKEAEAKRRVDAANSVQERQPTSSVELANPINYVMPPTNGERGSITGGHQQGGNHITDDYPHKPNSSHARVRNNIRSATGGASIGGGRSGRIGSVKGSDDGDAVSRPMQPTPYFERLVTEEVQELKAYVRIIENQNRRLAELERVHGDLETRLETESQGRQQLEATLEAREREWSKKFEQLRRDRDHWKDVVKAEQMTNARLKEQLLRKDQEIHRMLQRKYDHEGGRQLRNIRATGQSADRQVGPISSASKSPPDIFHKSPRDILIESGSAEKARVRNVEGLMLDFFGL